MTDTYFVWTGDSFKPVDDCSMEAANAYGDGEVVRIKMFKDRNPLHHRLFFGLLKLVWLPAGKIPVRGSPAIRRHYPGRVGRRDPFGWRQGGSQA